MAVDSIEVRGLRYCFYQSARVSSIHDEYRAAFVQDSDQYIAILTLFTLDTLHPFSLLVVTLDSTLEYNLQLQLYNYT